MGWIELYLSSVSQLRSSLFLTDSNGEALELDSISELHIAGICTVMVQSIVTWHLDGGGGNRPGTSVWGRAWSATVLHQKCLSGMNSLSISFCHRWRFSVRVLLSECFPGEAVGERVLHINNIAPGSHPLSHPPRRAPRPCLWLQKLRSMRDVWHRRTVALTPLLPQSNLPSSAHALLRSWPWCWYNVLSITTGNTICAKRVWNVSTSIHQFVRVTVCVMWFAPGWHTLCTFGD